MCCRYRGYSRVIRNAGQDVRVVVYYAVGPDDGRDNLSRFDRDKPAPDDCAVVRVPTARRYERLAYIVQARYYYSQRARPRDKIIYRSRQRAHTHALARSLSLALSNTGTREDGHARSAERRPHGVCDALPTGCRRRRRRRRP